MGNHDVGRGMNAAAQAYYLGRFHTDVEDEIPPTKEQALAVLDAVVDAGGWRGADAEFDDYANPPDDEDPSDLSDLIAVAFGPWEEKGDEEDEDRYDRWYKEIIKPFSKRYKFC